MNSYESSVSHDTKSVEDEHSGFVRQRSSIEVGVAYASLAGRHNLSAEEKKKILLERANKLSLSRIERDGDDDYLDVIEFMLDQERYAIEVKFIREVFPVKDLTYVPCTPPFVAGIINVRGQIMSVVDVKKFLDLPETELTDLSRVIILQNEDMELGLLTDEVVEERRIHMNEIHSDMPTLDGMWEKYISGVTKERLALVDVNKFLADKNIVVHEKVGD
jgi:purine-binding chemotaxis protein CheW